MHFLFIIFFISFLNTTKPIRSKHDRLDSTLSSFEDKSAVIITPQEPNFTITDAMILVCMHKYIACFAPFAQAIYAYKNFEELRSSKKLSEFYLISMAMVFHALIYNKNYSNFISALSMIALFGRFIYKTDTISLLIGRIRSKVIFKKPSLQKSCVEKEIVVTKIPLDPITFFFAGFNPLFQPISTTIKILTMGNNTKLYVNKGFVIYELAKLFINVFCAFLIFNQSLIFNLNLKFYREILSMTIMYFLQNKIENYTKIDQSFIAYNDKNFLFCFAVINVPLTIFIYMIRIYDLVNRKIFMYSKVALELSETLLFYVVFKFFIKHCSFDANFIIYLSIVLSLNSLLEIWQSLKLENKRGY